MDDHPLSGLRWGRLFSVSSSRGRPPIRLLATRAALPALVLSVLVALVVAACGPGTPPAAGSSPGSQTQKVPVEGGGSYTDVSARELESMLGQKDFPLVNVHIPYEGEIEGTRLFIPYNEIDRNLDRLPADRDARIVLYCRTGSMSAIAARVLVKRGYTDVWNLDGGMVGWKQAGYPLVDRGQGKTSLPGRSGENRSVNQLSA